MAVTTLDLRGMPMEMQLFCSMMLKAAGFDPDDLPPATGGQFNDEFVCIMQTLTYIGARKVDMYGDFRQQDLRSAAREIWGAYWDMQRKFGRIETQISLPFLDNADVTESCGDLAVYAVRMIQILRRLQERNIQ